MKARGIGGFSLIEMVIGISILGLVTLALVGTYNTYVAKALSNNRTIKAAYLLEEGVEAVKVLRDTGWASKIAALTPNQVYYLSYNGTTWISSVTPEVIDTNYSRSFTLSPVYRDSNSDIAVSGTLDVNIKKVTVTVSWNTDATTVTRTISTYITNLFAS